MPTPTEKPVLQPLGPAELWLTPLPPEIWREAQECSLGPGGFCLALLEMGSISWQGVAVGKDRAPETSLENLAALPAATAGLLLNALCQPWLRIREQEELDALERYLNFVVDYPGISCSTCREQERTGEDPPDCNGCPLPPLPDTCQEAIQLYPVLRSAPPGVASALLQPALSGLSPRQTRLLLMRLSLLHRLLGPPPGRPLAPA